MEFVMTLNKIDNFSINEAKSNETDEFSIPLHINDILSICQDFAMLKIQYQIEDILEYGVEEAIKNSLVKQESLPHVKCFLQKICKNPYFGDAAEQAEDCLALIYAYEDKYKISYSSN
jgi:hypothetical protein